MRVKTTTLQLPNPGWLRDTANLRAGRFFNSRMKYLRILFVLMLFSFLGIVKCYAQDFEEWSDKTTTWINSTLNDTRSGYFEGEVVPFVYRTANTLINGNSYSFTITMDYYNNAQNAGGFYQVQAYNTSRVVANWNGGSNPTQDGDFPAFYTVNADVTNVAATINTASNGSKTQDVTVTFTYTGATPGSADIYWGLYLSKRNTVAPGTVGASHYPGGSLSTTIDVSGTGNLGFTGTGVIEGLISGMKYSDLNKDGSKGNTEPGIQNWTIYLDLNNNDALDSGEPSTTTDANGNFAFSVLPGTYIVREQMQANWTQTQPTPGVQSGSYSVTITADAPQSTNNIFGNFTCATPKPTITPSGATTFCSGGSVLLTSSSATGNQWYKDGTILTGETNQTYTATASGSYTVTVTLLGCPNTSDGTTVTVQDISAAPTINSPICTGANSVSGTSSEADGTTIEVFVDGSSAGTTTVSGGLWSKTGLSLTTGQVVTAKAQASGECQSGESSSVTVKGNGTIALTSTTGTDAQTQCINHAITSITYAVGGTSTGASATGLPNGVTGLYNSGVFTISGTPTQAGVFNYTVNTSGSTCVNPTAKGSITVNDDGTISLTSTTGTDAQTVCINHAITSITYSIGGTATGASVTGSLPTGVNGLYNNGVFTISGTPTQSGTFNYTVTTTGSDCVNPHLDGSITVTADGTINLTSTTGTDAQTVCINHAITSITYSIGGTSTGASATGLPNGVTGLYNSGVFTISGTPSQSGTFNYTVTASGSGCVNPHLDGSITVTADGTINLTSASSTVSQTVCINHAITSITYAVGGTSTGASATGLPNGVTGLYNSGVFTISGTPTQAGVFNYTVNTSGSTCVNPTAKGSITVNDDGTISLTSASSTTSQSVCVNTAITSITYSIGGAATGANVTGLPAGVSSLFNNGVLTISGTPTTASSTAYSYTVTTTGSVCNNPSLGGTITVNPNVACAAYNGVYFGNTGSTNSGGSATINLVYNISAYSSATCKDISALTKSSFVVTANPSNAVSVNYNAASYSGGVYTVPVTISIPNNQYSITVQFNLGFSSSNYVFNAGCTDVPLITVSANSNDFVTGGGYVIPTNSYSKKPGSNANGLKNNLGFNVKWNKGFTNLQGNFNTIIRRAESDGIHLYQVKSANPGSLVVKQLSSTSYRADITYNNANIQDLTLGISTGEGPGTVYLTVIDNGEPGSNGSTTDQVLITVKDKYNALWYTSDQTANANVGDYTKSSTIPLLTRGNMQVHTSTKGGAVTTKDVQTAPTTLNQAFELRGTPNPTFSYFTIQLPNQNAARVNLRVTDVLGRVVEARPNLAPGGSLRIGSSYKPGVYIVEAIQGDVVKQIKLVKQ